MGSFAPSAVRARSSSATTFCRSAGVSARMTMGVRYALKTWSTLPPQY